MENNITEFGVYIKEKNGYVLMTTVQNTSYPEFRHLDKMSKIERNDDTIELLVYLENFSAASFTAHIRKLALAGNNEDIDFSVSPMVKKHMFRLTTSIKIPDGSSIFFPTGWDEITTVFLGDAEKEVIAFFSNMELKPAYAALQDLETILKVFSENAELAKLLLKWQTVEKLEKEVSDYKYVQEAWEKYQETEKISLKVRYLEKLQAELNGFLNNHPNGSMLVKCKDRQKEIDTKLPEYEKMI